MSYLCNAMQTLQQKFKSEVDFSSGQLLTYSHDERGAILGNTQACKEGVRLLTLKLKKEMDLYLPGASSRYILMEKLEFLHSEVSMLYAATRRSLPRALPRLSSATLSRVPGISEGLKERADAEAGLDRFQRVLAAFNAYGEEERKRKINSLRLKYPLPPQLTNLNNLLRRGRAKRHALLATILVVLHDKLMLLR